MCYWSESHHEVKVKYLTSLMFGQAIAGDVLKDMMIALEKLAVPIKVMVSLGMDEPNVNISIMEKLNKIERKKGFQQLVKCLPSCLIHGSHNSFCRGLEKYGLNAEELCMNLYYFFKRIACRTQDWFQMEESMSLEKLVVLHHVQS